MNSPNFKTKIGKTRLGWSSDFDIKNDGGSAEQKESGLYTFKKQIVMEISIGTSERKELQIDQEQNAAKIWVQYIIPIFHSKLKLSA